MCSGPNLSRVSLVRTSAPASSRARVTITLSDRAASLRARPIPEQQASGFAPFAIKPLTCFSVVSFSGCPATSRSSYERSRNAFDGEMQTQSRRTKHRLMHWTEKSATAPSTTEPQRLLDEYSCPQRDEQPKWLNTSFQRAFLTFCLLVCTATQWIGAGCVFAALGLALCIKNSSVADLQHAHEFENIC